MPKSDEVTQTGQRPRRNGRLPVRAAGLLSLLLAHPLIVISLAPTATSNDLTVTTVTGPVTGVLVDDAKQWRGVPYAAPPVGRLRWRPPQPATPWVEARDASQFHEPCAQSAFGSGTLIGSEDCLYLNVSAPATSAERDRLPVMVHLHAGGNGRGQPQQDATAFTDRGVVVVTVAYRLGAFGFAGHPALSAEGGGSSGEYGILDQIAALRWVRDNVAAFGGDPSNVTLFGFSAGSFDTVALMASPISRGLMTRAAVQGEATRALSGQFNTIADAEAFGVFLAEQVGCNRTADTAACLRQVSSARLAAAAGDLDLLPWVGGTVLPQSPEVLLKQGALPLLVGFGREENSGFFPPPQPPTPYARGSWIHDTNRLVGPLFGARVRALYPPEEYDHLWWSYITMLTDAIRGCATRRLANIVSDHAPVWRYLYTHTFSDPFAGQFRAAHGLEDVLLWQNAFEFFHMEPAELLLADQMTDYWTNFAKTGDPNGPGRPTWPRYDTATEPSLVLDTTTSTVRGYHREQCGLVDTVPIVDPLPFQQGARPPSLPRFPPGFG